jgi:signal transduction histidine kinase
MKTHVSTKKINLPNFPYLLTIISAVLLISSTLLFGFYSIEIYLHFKHEPTHERQIELRGIILQLDEVLTMSARMASATGDLKWEKRYNYYDSILVNAISELDKITNKKNINNIKKLKDTNEKLVAIERQAFNFIKQNKVKEAQKIMSSEEYEKQKLIYLNEINKNYSFFKQQSNLEIVYKNQLQIFLMTIIFITMITAILTSILSFKKMQIWKLELNNAIEKELQYQKELEEGRALLEHRIQQRTLELSNKNHELSHTVDQLRLAQKNLIQSEKMATIGQLSAGIAHEINNPLSFVMSNTNTLQKYLSNIMQLLDLYQNLLKKIEDSKLPPLQELTQKIISLITEKKIVKILSDLDNIINESKEGLTRIKKIVSNLGSFASIKSETIGKININSCIESSIEMVWNKLKYNCEINKNLSDVPLIYGSPEQLKMVIMALLLNAADAITKKGIITITSKKSDSMIEITIHDTGCGIKPEHLSKLFTPFFTTKPVGSGIGLGLAIAYGIIQSYNGTITAESEVGSGSTFTIQLPIREV